MLTRILWTAETSFAGDRDTFQLASNRTTILYEDRALQDDRTHALGEHLRCGNLGPRGLLYREETAPWQPT